MRVRFPQFTRSTKKTGSIAWKGTLQPTMLSDAYLVEIAYEPPFRPRIRVLSPPLRLRDDCHRQPHTFEDGTLCVHESYQWDGHQLVAETIVPWICLWLFFYQTWLQTGAWRGEGTHPDLPQHRPVIAAS